MSEALASPVLLALLDCCASKTNWPDAVITVAAFAFVAWVAWLLLGVYQIRNDSDDD